MQTTNWLNGSFILVVRHCRGGPIANCNFSIAIRCKSARHRVPVTGMKMSGYRWHSALWRVGNTATADRAEHCHVTSPECQFAVSCIRKAHPRPFPRCPGAGAAGGAPATNPHADPEGAGNARPRSTARPRGAPATGDARRESLGPERKGGPQLDDNEACRKIAALTAIVQTMMLSSMRRTRGSTPHSSGRSANA